MVLHFYCLPNMNLFHKCGVANPFRWFAKKKIPRLRGIFSVFKARQRLHTVRIRPLTQHRRREKRQAGLVFSFSQITLSPIRYRSKLNGVRRTGWPTQVSEYPCLMPYLRHSSCISIPTQHGRAGLGAYRPNGLKSLLLQSNDTL